MVKFLPVIFEGDFCWGKLASDDEVAGADMSNFRLKSEIFLGLISPLDASETFRSPPTVLLSLELRCSVANFGDGSLDERFVEDLWTK